MKRKPPISVTPILFASFLGWMGSASAETVERIVARVNGQIITQTELQSEVDMTFDRIGAARTSENTKEVSSQVLDRMIDNVLVLQVADERGLRVPTRFFEDWKQNVMARANIATEEELERHVALQGETVSALRERFERSLKIREIRRLEVESKIAVSEPEIEEYYRQHIQDYTEPTRVRLRELVLRFDAGSELEQGEKARTLRRELRRGADFAELARMHSQSGSAEVGGDIGSFREGELAEPLAAAAFALEAGGVTEVLRVERAVMGMSAYYILRVDERSDARTKEFDEVRNEVADILYEEKLDAQMKRFIRRLRERARVDVALVASEP